MKYKFEAMTKSNARAILSWRYESPYDVYNADPKGIEADLQWFLDPQYAYSSICNDASELVGFCNFGKDAQVPGGNYDLDALDVGGGLKPELTGRGLGLGFIQAILEFGRSQYRPECFRGTVATFNQRCLRMCEHAGFKRLQTFMSQGKYQSKEYVILIKEV